MAIIRGLTLHRPWGWAVRALNKRVENRTHPCFLPVGSYIAIHNGKKWDENGAQFLEEINPSGLFENPENDQEDCGLIVCVARFVGCVEYSSSEWFSGPYGWVLDNVYPLTTFELVKVSKVSGVLIRAL
jgi:hypothetical protein